MLTKQLYLATNQIQKMQSLFLKSEEKLKVKEQEINLLKRKVQVKKIVKTERKHHLNIFKEIFMCCLSKIIKIKI